MWWYRFRIALFLIVSLGIVAVLYTTAQGIETLARLKVVERERDLWQRPSEIIQALNLRNGAVVVDLGSGAGYFALKLSPLVGENGKVLAVDPRRLPLAYLRVRARLWKRNNVIAMGEDADDPHLPSRVDAALIVNTFQTLTAPKALLDGIRQSLAAGGRLVIVDLGRLAPVEEQVRQAGFQIVRTSDHFVAQPGMGPGWLIVAQSN